MARDDELGRLPIDRTTADLRQLAAALDARLRAVAVVRRELPDDSGIVEGVDVDPHREDAVGVWWMHSAEDIIVGLGKGRGWELPRSVETVEVVRSVVRQAVAGQIEVGRGRGVTLYRVRTSDGVVREDTHEGWAAFLLSMPWRPKMRWNDAAPYDRD